MEQTKTHKQVVLIFGMFALLLAASLFDKWQEFLEKGFVENFETQYINLRLWSLPVGMFLFSVCWLILSGLMVRNNHKVTATLYLIVGICILFYPPLGMSLGLLSELARFGISMDYFADSVLFYSSALVAGMGLIGLINSVGITSEVGST